MERVRKEEERLGLEKGHEGCMGRYMEEKRKWD